MKSILQKARSSAMSLDFGSADDESRDPDHSWQAEMSNPLDTAGASSSDSAFSISRAMSREKMQKLATTSQKKKRTRPSPIKTRQSGNDDDSLDRMALDEKVTIHSPTAISVETVEVQQGRGMWGQGAITSTGPGRRRSGEDDTRLSQVQRQREESKKAAYDRAARMLKRTDTSKIAAGKIQKAREAAREAVSIMEKKRMAELKSEALPRHSKKKTRVIKQKQEPTSDIFPAALASLLDDERSDAGLSVDNADRYSSVEEGPTMGGSGGNSMLDDVMAIAASRLTRGEAIQNPRSIAKQEQETREATQAQKKLPKQKKQDGAPKSQRRSEQMQKKKAAVNATKKYSALQSSRKISDPSHKELDDMMDFAASRLQGALSDRYVAAYKPKRNSSTVDAAQRSAQANDPPSDQNIDDCSVWSDEFFRSPEEEILFRSSNDLKTPAAQNPALNGARKNPRDAPVVVKSVRRQRKDAESLESNRSPDPEPDPHSAVQSKRTTNPHKSRGASGANEKGDIQRDETEKAMYGRPDASTIQKAHRSGLKASALDFARRSRTQKKGSESKSTRPLSPDPRTTSTAVVGSMTNSPTSPEAHQLIQETLTSPTSIMDSFDKTHDPSERTRNIDRAAVREARLSTAERGRPPTSPRAGSTYDRYSPTPGHQIPNNLSVGSDQLKPSSKSNLAGDLSNKPCKDEDKATKKMSKSYSKRNHLKPKRSNESDGQQDDSSDRAFHSRQLHEPFKSTGARPKVGTVVVPDVADIPVKGKMLDYDDQYWDTLSTIASTKDWSGAKVQQYKVNRPAPNPEARMKGIGGIAPPGAISTVCGLWGYSPSYGNVSPIEYNRREGVQNDGHADSGSDDSSRRPRIPFAIAYHAPSEPSAPNLERHRDEAIVLPTESMNRLQSLMTPSSDDDSDRDCLETEDTFVQQHTGIDGSTSEHFELAVGRGRQMAVEQAVDLAQDHVDHEVCRANSRVSDLIAKFEETPQQTEYSKTQAIDEISSSNKDMVDSSASTGHPTTTSNVPHISRDESLDLVLSSDSTKPQVEEDCIEQEDSLDVVVSSPSAQWKTGHSDEVTVEEKGQDDMAVSPVSNADGLTDPKSGDTADDGSALLLSVTRSEDWAINKKSSRDSLRRDHQEHTPGKALPVFQTAAKVVESRGDMESVGDQLQEVGSELVERGHTVPELTKRVTSEPDGGKFDLDALPNETSVLAPMVSDAQNTTWVENGSKERAFHPVNQIDFSEPSKGVSETTDGGKSASPILCDIAQYSTRLPSKAPTKKLETIDNANIGVYANESNVQPVTTAVDSASLPRSTPPRTRRVRATGRSSKLQSVLERIRQRRQDIGSGRQPKLAASRSFEQDTVSTLSSVGTEAVGDSNVAPSMTDMLSKYDNLVEKLMKEHPEEHNSDSDSVNQLLGKLRDQRDCAMAKKFVRQHRSDGDKPPKPVHPSSSNRSSRNHRVSLSEQRRSRRSFPSPERRFAEARPRPLATSLPHSQRVHPNLDVRNDYSTPSSLQSTHCVPSKSPSRSRPFPEDNNRSDASIASEEMPLLGARKRDENAKLSSKSPSRNRPFPEVQRRKDMSISSSDSSVFEEPMFEPQLKRPSATFSHRRVFPELKRRSPETSILGARRLEPPSSCESVCHRAYSAEKRRPVTPERRRSRSTPRKMHHSTEQQRKGHDMSCLDDARHVRHQLDLARLTSQAIQTSHASLSDELQIFKEKLAYHASLRRGDTAVMERHRRKLGEFHERVQNPYDDDLRQAWGDFDEVRGLMLNNVSLMNDAKEALKHERILLDEQAEEERQMHDFSRSVNGRRENERVTQRHDVKGKMEDLGTTDAGPAQTGRTAQRRQPDAAGEHADSRSSRADAEDRRRGGEYWKTRLSQKSHARDSTLYDF